MKTFTFMCCFMIAAAFVQSQVIHVPADYPAIQQGINAANPGDTVLVSDGTYYEQINFLGKKPLTVASEYLTDGDESHIANTIIDGSQIPDGDSCSVVYFINGEDTTSVLCGFTIQHGKGTIYTTPLSWLKGGGGVFLAGSGAKIIHNHITENHLSDTLQGYPPITTGAAIHTKWEISDSLWVIVADNTIDHNSCKSHLTEASAAGMSICSNSRITNNIISWNSTIGTGNAYAGSAAYICGTNPDWSTTVTTVVENNLITNNLAKSDNKWANAAGGGFQAISGILENNFIAYNEVASFSASWGGLAGFFASGPKEGTVVRGNTFKMNKSNANGGALGFEPISEVYVVLVENNYFIENEGILGGALWSSHIPVILQNNVFSGNSASMSGGGIYMRGTQSQSIPHYAVLMNNSFSGNKANTGGGAIISIGINPVITNTIFWNDSSNVALGPEIYLNGPSDTLEITHSNIDFSLIKGKVIDGGGNINYDPQFDDPDLLTILESSPCIEDGTATFTCQCGQIHYTPGYDIDNLIRPWPENGGFDMGAHEFGSVPHGHILHVPAEYNTIQAGINAANSGDTVLVSDGIYYEQINFLGKKPLMVASEYLTTGDESHIASTVIDGSQIPDGDSCSVVYFINNEDTTSVLCGFTIRNGNIGTAAAYPTGGYLQSGGAVYIFGSGAKIMYNHITQNSLNGIGFKTTGAGISAGQWWEDSHWVVIDHNTIDNNSCYSDSQQTFGTGICLTCNTRITNNVISDNVNHGTGSAIGAAAGIFAGGELYWQSLTAVVINNTLKNNVATSENNYGGGAGGAFQCNSVIFQGNIVEDNEVNTTSSSGGGVMFWAPRTGSVFSGNTFRHNIINGSGGGLYLEYVSTNVGSDTVLVENNYFNENSATIGGGFATKNNPAVLQNNVFTLNHGTNSGGAINIRGNNLDHTAILMNNSFYQNSTGGQGGAIYSFHGRPLIINSIFYQDTASSVGNEIYLATTSDTVEIAFSDIDPTHIEPYSSFLDGGGNIDCDPLFIDSDLLIPSEGSCTINTGTDVFTCVCGITNNSPGYDILGSERPIDGTFDMGAYEWYLGVGIPAVVSHHSSVVSFPNPFTAYTTLEYELEHSSSVNLSVYNHLGQQVAVLVDGEQSEGRHQLRWNAEGMPAGIYFYRLTTDDCRLTTGKLVVVR